MWYKRSEAQKRFSLFFSSTNLAGAFGGLLAAAIGNMNGLRGYSGWRWIFILEGVLTCVVSFILFFTIPDFPEDVKWLNEEERAFIKDRLARDSGHAARNKPLGWRDVVDVLRDCEHYSHGFGCHQLIINRQDSSRWSHVLWRHCHCIQ
jgi:peroxin-3